MGRSLIAIAALTILGFSTAFADEFGSDRVVSPTPPLARIASSPKPAEPPKPPENTKVAETEEPHLVVSEPTPNKMDIRLRGRIEADADMVDQNAKNKLIYGNFLNAVGFRRARLGAEGTVGEQVRWVTEIDFAGGDLRLRDAYLAVDKLPIIREVRVGHMREPFSLEGQTSSTLFPFTERSPVNALDPSRNWGVGVFSYSDDKRITIQAGAFKSGTDSTGTDIGDGNDMAYTGRVTALPWFEERDDQQYLWHIGGAISQRYAKNDEVTFDQGPQSTLLQTGDSPLILYVPNLTVPAKQNQLFNLQSALVLGSLSFQAEWSATQIDQIGGGPVFLQGAYIFASYFLTGEQRRYHQEYGTFLPPKVNSPFVCLDGASAESFGPGAWELVARFGWLDFDSPNLAPTADGLKAGTNLTTYTFGINWYLNDNARIMFNYVLAIPVDPNFGSSSANSFTIRSAIFW